VSQRRHRVLTIGVTSISRILILRDRILGRIARDERLEFSDTKISHHKIQSGSNLLDAVFVQPGSGPARASLLLCHGIGETVKHWLVVQQLLATHGIASLVFDYSGFGRSSGSFSANQSEHDTVSAFLHLQALTPQLPISVLGLSLGSAIAAAAIHRVSAHRLFLCGAFTSLRKGAVSIALPKYLQFLVPAIWDSEETLRTCPIPVVVVHGEKDRLFPVQMATDLVASRGAPSEVLIVPDLSHNEPFHRPHLSYWGLIISRLCAGQ
jgi:pimeloyl-ACP methyl ester carboxylesterase